MTKLCPSSLEILHRTRQARYGNNNNKLHTNVPRSLRPRCLKTRHQRRHMPRVSHGGGGGGAKDAAAPSSVNTGPKVGGFSADSIKAVETMRFTLDANMKADPTPALTADEQHLLMLHFNLETHDYVMQSHTWMDVESKDCN